MLGLCDPASAVMTLSLVLGLRDLVPAAMTLSLVLGMCDLAPAAMTLSLVLDLCDLAPAAMTEPDHKSEQNINVLARQMLTALPPIVIVPQTFDLITMWCCVDWCIFKCTVL